MSRTFKIILALNLVILAVLTFTYPHLMVGPGKLIPGHQKLESDCFACHAPLTGASSERCVSCHKPEDIGRLTSAGLPIAKPLTSTPFHQKLIRQDCVACHSDHAGVKRFKQQGGFSHALLQKQTRNQCESCHKAPTDPLHKQMTGTTTDAAAGATTANCGQCHSQEKWTPATFDHDKYFSFDRNHTTECATCHVRNDYQRYTCFGCHEHTPVNIRRKHIEEGIRDYDNCVECHRSGDEHDIRGGGRGEGGGEGGKRRKGGHDD